MGRLGRPTSERRPSGVVPDIQGDLATPSTGTSTSRGRALRVALRALVGVVVVVLLLARADLHALVNSIAEVRPGYVVLAFAVVLLGLMVNAYRWQLFLRPVGLAQQVSELLRLTFVGTFFNAFLPTGFGGDAYKSLRLRGEAGSMAPPLATVFLDRLAGLVGLSLLALVGSVLQLTMGDHGRVTVAASLLSLGVLGAWGLALWFSARWADRDEAASRVNSRIRAFARAFATAGREPRAMLWGTVVGGLSALLLVTVFALLAAAVGVSVPTAAFPGIVLITSLMTILPLTINGFGFREAMTVWCLAAYGVGHDEALAFALLVLAVTLASSAVGGIVYVVARGPAADTYRVASAGSRARPGPRTRSAG